MYDNCSKFTRKTTERRQWRRSSAFTFHYEHIPHIVLVFQLLHWKGICPLIIISIGFGFSKTWTWSHFTFWKTCSEIYCKTPRKIYLSGSSYCKTAHFQFETLLKLASVTDAFLEMLQKKHFWEHLCGNASNDHV